MKKERLLAAVHAPGDFPAHIGPLVAFGGRSNVGKSSLLNALLGIPVARTSKTPGRTRAIYLFDTREGWVAADLPGFGFAAVSRGDRASWKELAASLFERETPLLTVQLIDSRIPTSDFDLDFRDYLRDLALRSSCVATKADRLNQSERSRARARLEKEFGDVLFVSSRTGEGIEALRKRIQKELSNGETP
ncbi:MAG: ribosome biogenesis GTP-binding protein YihA/YsxC [Thermoanaerobaculia bacterium]